MQPADDRREFLVGGAGSVLCVALAAMPVSGQAETTEQLALAPALALSHTDKPLPFEAGSLDGIS
jgi:hypothetical protein